MSKLPQAIILCSHICTDSNNSFLHEGKNSIGNIYTVCPQIVMCLACCESSTMNPHLSLSSPAIFPVILGYFLRVALNCKTVLAAGQSNERDLPWTCGSTHNTDAKVQSCEMLLNFGCNLILRCSRTSYIRHPRDFM